MRIGEPGRLYVDAHRSFRLPDTSLLPHVLLAGMPIVHMYVGCLQSEKLARRAPQTGRKRCPRPDGLEAAFV